MLGTDLRDELLAHDIDFQSLSRADLDVTNVRTLKAAIGEARPTVIVNCAAYTRVDDAEANEHAANAINGSAVELIANAANEAGALLIQVSTDFVFDGSKQSPYEVTDRTSPLSAYGRSKLLGEIAAAHAERHLILRTSWLFGIHGHNFVEAIRSQVLKGTNPLRVVDDQRGRPTYTAHVARAILRLSRHPEARGIVHYADEPECSWFDFAQAIVEEMGASTDVLPVSTEEFPRPAKRPPYSVLSTERYERITGVGPDSWRDGLSEYLHRRP